MSNPHGSVARPYRDEAPPFVEGPQPRVAVDRDRRRVTARGRLERGLHQRHADAVALQRGLDRDGSDVGVGGQARVEPRGSPDRPRASPRRRGRRGPRRRAPARRRSSRRARRTRYPTTWSPANAARVVVESDSLHPQVEVLHDREALERVVCEHGHVVLGPEGTAGEPARLGPAVRRQRADHDVLPGSIPGRSVPGATLGPSPSRSSRRHAHRRDEVRRYVGGLGGAPAGGGRPGRARPRGGQRRDRRGERDGRHDRRPPGDGRGDHRPARPARAGHAAHGGRADLDVAARDRAERAGLPRGELHRIAGRDHHRHAPRRREDHRDPAEADPRGPRCGQRRDPRRVPGPVERLRDHDARARGLRSHGGRDGRRRRRRGLRDLHRRRGRVHRRPTDRPGRAEGRHDRVRRDARARRGRREGVCRPGRSRWRAATASRSTSGRRSTMRPARGCARGARTRWKAC